MFSSAAETQLKGRTCPEQGRTSYVQSGRLQAAAARDHVEVGACGTRGRRWRSNRRGDVQEGRGKFTLQPLTGTSCRSAVGICATGTYTGDASGPSVFVGSSLIQTVDTPTTAVVLLTADNIITSKNGQLLTKDAIVLQTTSDGAFAEVDTLVGGTGVWAGTQGQLRATGTFTVSSGGSGDYAGEVCSPQPKRKLRGPTPVVSCAGARRSALANSQLNERTRRRPSDRRAPGRAGLPLLGSAIDLRSSSAIRASR
jgi:hypothetical protein